jgi:hypothetical protein
VAFDGGRIVAWLRGAGTASAAGIVMMVMAHQFCVGARVAMAEIKPASPAESVVIFKSAIDVDITLFFREMIGVLDGKEISSSFRFDFREQHDAGGQYFDGIKNIQLPVMVPFDFHGILEIFSRQIAHINVGEMTNNLGSVAIPKMDAERLNTHISALNDAGIAELQNKETEAGYEEQKGRYYQPSRGNGQLSRKFSYQAFVIFVVTLGGGIAASVAGWSLLARNRLFTGFILLVLGFFTLLSVGCFATGEGPLGWIYWHKDIL